VTVDAHVLPVTASAIAKRCRRYEARGEAGMADHRTGKPNSPYGRADPAVAEAMRQAIAEAEHESSRAATYLPTPRLPAGRTSTPPGRVISTPGVAGAG